MSDVMLFGVLRMPYEMAMSNELSRRQFYGRVQEAADRIEALEAEVEKLRAELSERDSALRAEPAGQHKFGTPETLDEKALNALLWFYRRMVNAYGRLPFAEEAIAGLRARIVTTRCRAEGGNTNQVGCERDDGLLNIHAESETCEVCSAPAAGTDKDAAQVSFDAWYDHEPRKQLIDDLSKRSVAYSAWAAAIAAHTSAGEAQA